MDHSDVVAQFCGITDASAHVAENYLEAMEWQLERAIDFYMEHPPNHEADRFDADQPPAPGFHPVRSAAIEIPDDDDDAAGLAELAQHRAGGLAARQAAEEQEEGVLLAEGLAIQANLMDFEHDDGRALPAAMTAQDEPGLHISGGINLEEARMLEAAMLGIPYEGRLPDFSGAQAAAAAAAPLSPGTIEQRTLQQEEEAAAERAEAEAKQQLAELLATKQQRLMDEPAASEPGVLKIVVRMPDGSRKGRRFKATDPLQALFDYVDVECAGSSGSGDNSAAAAAEPGFGFKMGRYRLVTQFPRKVFVEGLGQSLQDAGIASDTAMFVEPLT
eukprot:gene6310-6545_t